MERLEATLPRTLSKGCPATREAPTCTFRGNAVRLSQRQREGNNMNGIRLTRRGWIVVAVAFVAIWWLALNAITPEECKGVANELSVKCQEYLR